jgi:hypothetical protein
MYDNKISYLFEYSNWNNAYCRKLEYHDTDNIVYNKVNKIYDDIIKFDIDIRYIDYISLLSNNGLNEATKIYRRLMGQFLKKNLKIVGIRDLCNMILDYCI